MSPAQAQRRIADSDSGASTGRSGGFGFERPIEGKTNDWLTPPKLVEALGEFDLDPAGCPDQPWLLAKMTYFPPEQDGLTLPWFGRVYCNPPYGPHVESWVRRMAEHRNGIMLIFSRTETTAWQEVWKTGDAFFFPYGRICFYLPSGQRAKSGTAPSALVAYGKENVCALRQAGLAGCLLEREDWFDGVKVSHL